MSMQRIASIGVLACLLAAFTQAGAQSSGSGNCVNVGLTLNSACGQFTSAIQQNYQTILSTDCTALTNTLSQPQYGTPSAECCNAAASFFSAGCACDSNVQTQAQLFYGWSVQQLDAAATAAAIRCNAYGCGSKCPAVQASSG